MRKVGGTRLPRAPVVYSRCPMDAEDIELGGGEAAILDEAVAWLHFAWGQNVPWPPPPPGEQGVKHLRHLYTCILPTSPPVRGGEL